MKLQYFNGGLNTREGPHLIGQSESTVLENVDVAPGQLTPIRGLGSTVIPLNKYSYYYEFADEWVSSAINRDYLEYQDVLYYTEEGSYPKKYSGGVESRLGIVGPTSTPTIDLINNKSSAVSDVTMVSVGGIGDLLGQYSYTTETCDGCTETASRATKYFYRFVVVTPDGRVSNPFDKEIVTTYSGDGGIRFTALTDGPPTPADGKVEIYRKFQGVYRYVADYSVNYEDTVVDIRTNKAYTKEGKEVGDIINLDGTYQYVYTYYNSNDGAESQPSSVAVDAIVERGFVTLGNIVASTDPQVTDIKLYRIGGNLTEFTLVTTLPNTSTTYKDTTADVDVEGSILETTSYAEAPDGLKFLTEAYGSFLGAIDDKVYYTPTGLPNAWPTTNFIDFEAPITGIGLAANGVVVFSKYKAWVVTGTNASTFVKYPLSGDQGCLEHKAIVKIGSSIMWPSTDGICVTTGANATVVSKPKLGKIALSPANAVVHDEEYYLQETDGSILVVDMRFNTAKFKRYNIGTTWLVVALDTLYGYTGTGLSEFFIGDNATLTYTSPLLAEASLTELKTFKDFYVHCEGSVTITIKIDDNEVITKSFTTKGTYDIIVPQALQQGYTLQFEITGTGTVYEIEFKALGRQNGR